MGPPKNGFSGLVSPVSSSVLHTCKRLNRIHTHHRTGTDKQDVHILYYTCTQYKYVCVCVWVCVCGYCIMYLAFHLRMHQLLMSIKMLHQIVTCFLIGRGKCFYKADTVRCRHPDSQIPIITDNDSLNCI